MPGDHPLGGGAAFWFCLWAVIVESAAGYVAFQPNIFQPTSDNPVFVIQFTISALVIFQTAVPELNFISRRTSGLQQS
jgi:hypothetical protein